MKAQDLTYLAPSFHVKSFAAVGRFERETLWSRDMFFVFFLGYLSRNDLFGGVQLVVSRDRGSHVDCEGGY